MPLIFPLWNHAIALGIDSTDYQQFAMDADNYAHFQLLNGDFVGAEISARRGIALDSTK